MILTRANVTTLPFILPVLMEGHDILWGDIAAIATLGALPVVILAFALQKYLVRGLSFGTLRAVSDRSAITIAKSVRITATESVTSHAEYHDLGLEAARFHVERFG